MDSLNFRNVVVICVTVIVCTAMVVMALVHESVLNHKKGNWDDKVTVTVKSE